MAKQLKGRDFMDFGYIPDFSLFMNCNEVFGHIMSNIHNNANISQEVKDAWTKLYVINNIDKLYEYYE